jgi:putative copper resistance protein D
MTIALSVAITAGLYAWGVVRARRFGRVIPPHALAAFACALGLVVATLTGPLDTLSDRWFSWHMVQHFVLSTAIAPLVLLGAPARVALAASPPRAARFLARVLASRPIAFLTQPAVAWLQFMLVLYGIHFSPFYEAALEHETIHAAEHALILASGLVFWTPVLAVAPAPHAPPYYVRISMLFLALPVMSFLGFIIYVTHRVLYAHYAALPGALDDQTNAGAVAWITGGTPLFGAMLALVAAWGARERRLET